MNLKILSGFAWQSQCHLAFTSAPRFDTNDDVTELLAGSGTQGFLNGQGALADFNDPGAVAADFVSNIYVADTGNRSKFASLRQTALSQLLREEETESCQATERALRYRRLSRQWSATIPTLWIVAYDESWGLLQIANSGLVVFLAYFNGVSLGSGLCVDSANNLYYSWQYLRFLVWARMELLDVFAGSGNSGSSERKWYLRLV